MKARHEADRRPNRGTLLISAAAAARTPLRWTAFPALVALALAQPAGAQPQWHVDSAEVRFEIRNAGWPVRGSFAGLEAYARFDPDDPTDGEIVASIDAATVRTGIGMRDRHLLKREYFDVERHPRIRMTSLRIERGERQHAYRGTFALAVKDNEREITIPFTFTPHARGGTFEASFTIDRLDFGIGESSLILGNDVTVQLRLDASRVLEPALVTRSTALQRHGPRRRFHLALSTGFGGWWGQAPRLEPEAISP